MSTAVDDVRGQDSLHGLVKRAPGNVGLESMLVEIAARAEQRVTEELVNEIRRVTGKALGRR